MLKEHLKRKPKVKINELPEEEQVEQTKRVNAWVTRLGILLRKIGELTNESKWDRKRLYKQ